MGDTKDGWKERTVSLLQEVTFDLDDRITEWNRHHDDNLHRSDVINTMVQVFVWGRVPEEGTREREVLEHVSDVDPAALTWDLDDRIRAVSFPTAAHDDDEVINLVEDVDELINLVVPALLWGEFPEAGSSDRELLEETVDVEILDRKTDSKGRARLGGAQNGDREVVLALSWADDDS